MNIFQELSYFNELKEWVEVRRCYHYGEDNTPVDPKFEHIVVNHDNKTIQGSLQAYEEKVEKKQEITDKLKIQLKEKEESQITEISKVENKVMVENNLDVTIVWPLRLKMEEISSSRMYHCLVIGYSC